MALFTENYQEEMMHILKDMAHVRISGTKEEADCEIICRNAAKKWDLKLVWRHFRLKCVISTKQY